MVHTKKCFDILDPLILAKYESTTHFAQRWELQESTYLANLLFLRAIGANQQGGWGLINLPGRPRYAKGLAGRGLKETVFLPIF